MTKTNVLWTILNLIFVIILNALFYILGGTDHKGSVWMSYVFIHFAYLMLIITPILVRKGKNWAIFGFSIYSISTGYFLAQFATGIVFILIKLDSINIPLLVQVILAGIYGILLLANMMANERTAEAEAMRQPQIAYIKDSAVRLKSVMDRIHDKGAKKRLEKLYDIVYTSPIKSHPEVAQIEYYITQTIGEMEHASYAGNIDAVMSLADSLTNAVNDRNLRLRTLN